MIDHDTVEKIHAAANIVEIISDFIPVKKKGVNYQACCPFHNEKTPSFVISPSNGYYKCFGCGEGGGSISFVMKHESLSYPDALRYVAKRYGIEIVETHVTKEGQERATKKEAMMAINVYAAEYFGKQLRESADGRNIALSYFRERGFNDATIDKFALGYCPSNGDYFSTEALSKGYKEEFLVDTGLTIKREQGGYYDRFSGRVMFPITTFTGRIIGFGGRTMRTDKNTAKYLNSPESEIYHKSDTLYGISQSKRAITQNDKVFLVEGYTDVISMHQNGIENVVASSGTSLTDGQVQLIGRITKNVTVLYDGDSAGIKASLKGIDILLKGGLNVRVVLLPEGEDPDSFARGRSSEELIKYIDEVEVDFLSFKSKLLIDEVKNDPIGRATVITEVIRSISVIDDDVIRSQYIKECSTLLDCDVEMVISEVAKRRAYARDGEAGVQVEQNKRRKKEIELNKNILKPSVSLSEQSQEELLKFEKEIGRYLILHGYDYVTLTPPESEPINVSVAELIFNELDVDEIEFTDDLCKQLFNMYRGMYGKKDDSTSDADTAMLVNDPNVVISGFVVDMLAREKEHELSKHWNDLYGNKRDDLEGLSVEISKSIELYKTKLLNHKSMLLHEKLATTTDEMEKLNIFRELADINNIITPILKKYSRIKQ